MGVHPILGTKNMVCAGPWRVVSLCPNDMGSAPAHFLVKFPGAYLETPMLRTRGLRHGICHAVGLPTAWLPQKRFGDMLGRDMRGTVANPVARIERCFVVVPSFPR